MTVRSFMIGTLATLILSWGILALIIMWVDPLSSTASVAFILFFLSIFLAVSSTAALVGYGVRSVFLRSQLPAYRVRPALRQGVFLGVFVDLLLFLQLERLLVWWVSAIIVLLFIVVELVFISYDKYGTTNQGAGEKSA
jgi:hypothetical protein